MRGLFPGSILRGTKFSYRLLDKLSNSIFKAEIIPTHSALPPPQTWAIIKTASIEDEPQASSLIQEHHIYTIPRIAQSKHIRKLYDSINTPTHWSPQKPFCLALEWMDMDLGKAWEKGVVVPGDPGGEVKVLETVLGALGELEEGGLVYTDMKPANVLVSGGGTDEVRVKLGGLGNTIDEAGNEGWCQPVALRAPEVWTHGACYHKSDVWSAAALVVWGIDNQLLVDDTMRKWDVNLQMSHVLAKLMCLFEGSYTLPVPEPSDEWLQNNLKTASDMAESLRWARKPNPLDPASVLPKVPRIELWAKAMVEGGLAPEVLDVVLLMLVPDPLKRPTAKEVLTSKEFKALKTLVAKRHKRSATSAH